MAKHIGQFTPVTSLGDGDLFHVQQSGIDKRASATVVKELTKQVASEVNYDNTNSGFSAINVKSALDESYQYLLSVTGAFILKGSIDLSTGDSALPLEVDGLTAGWLYTCAVAGVIDIYNPVGEVVEATSIIQGDRVYYYDSLWWVIRSEKEAYDWEANYTGTGAVSINATYRLTSTTGVGETFEATLGEALLTGNFIAIHNSYASQGTLRVVNPTHTITGKLGQVNAGDDLIIGAGRTLYLVKRTATILEIVNNN